MATGQLTTVLRHLPGLAAEATDAQLLERFITRHEEAAFAALVRRYGPLVLGVCRRVLGNEHDAEDAFQATFLILVRKAAEIVAAEALGGWLYQVAFRTAQRARSAAAVRHRHERRAPAMTHPEDHPAAARPDLAPVLDEEVSRLPEETRLPFILCYIEGKTYKQAAHQLGCAPGTLSRRLGQARKLLRIRLARRGLTLSAGGLAAALAELPAAAAVPAPLAAATVRAALLSAAGPALAAGGIAPQVASLTEGGLRAMAGVKWKIILALLLTVSGLGAGLAVWARQAGAEKRPAQAPTQAPPRPRAAPSPAAKPKPDADVPAKDRTVITGRVCDAAGKPVAGAHIAVIGREVFDYRRVVEDYRGETILGKGRADRRGRFRLVIPRTSQDLFWGLGVLAASPGHALARAAVDVDAQSADVDIQLGKEEVLRGRLIDVQGQAVKGVKVEVLAVHKHFRGVFDGFHFHNTPADLPGWPQPAVSDGQGRFALRGLGPDWNVQLHTRDGRFARQDRESLAKDRRGGKEVVWALAPARTAEGTVTYADTKKPVPRAWLYVETSLGQYQGIAHRVPARADDHGRFRLVLPEGKHVTIRAYPPPGEPYLIQSWGQTWPEREISKKGINVSLPRGLLVRGTVTEKPSGRPVAGATVEFVRFVENNRFFNAPGKSPVAVTSAKGRFELPVVPGPGHLLVKGPTPDYLHEEISPRKLYGRINYSNWLVYPDAVAALNLKPNAGPHEVALTLRRGVTVRGTVVTPDGKPVHGAYLACRNYLNLGFTLNGIQSRLVKEGRFELPGCDPDGTVQAFFLDLKNRLGAVVEVSGKQAGKPVAVKLQPCGTARVRFVDRTGKPLAGAYPSVGVVLTPGVPYHVRNDPKPFAAVIFNEHGSKPDAQGRVTLPALIPGAPLMLTGLDANGVYLAVHKEFKVRPGQTVDLGDVVVRKQGKD
jgi:RNA polymerase sigma factor (sigma-70 family)